MITELDFRKSSYSGRGVDCLEVAALPQEFRTSSYSAQDQNCLEVAALPQDFHTSSYSAQGQDCVAVAGWTGGAAMRDSKHPEQGYLAFPRNEWAALLHATRVGDL